MVFPTSGGEPFLRSDHIQRILSESVDTGRGGRAKNLKVYIRFFDDENALINDLERSCERIENGSDNEYQCRIGENATFYFDKFSWGIVAYHSLDEDGTNIFDSYLRDRKYLRKPWLDKRNFEKLSKHFREENGKIMIERCLFEPYEDYSDYVMSLQVRGRKTKEVIQDIESKYALHPRTIGFELGGDGIEVKFGMTNTGRISFSSGNIDAMILVIGKYVSFLREKDENYEFIQSKKLKIGNVELRQPLEIVSLKLPSSDKIGGTRDERNSAIIRMLTAGEGEFGYIGIPIGPDRANILDLRERKNLQVTIRDDELFVYSENPSKARSAIRTLVSKIAEHIDPDVEVVRIRLGGQYWSK